MHFSRNPPGPNTSFIDVLAVSPRVPLLVFSDSLARTFRSSSSGTYFLSAAFAVGITHFPPAALLEFLVFFPRISSRPSAGERERTTAKDTYKENVPLVENGRAYI